MPGVPGCSTMQELVPEEPAHQALQELRQELQVWRQAVERRVEEALGLVRPLAAAVGELHAQNASLRAEQQRLSLRMAHLGVSRTEPEEKDPSTLLLESGDPCADFAGTEEPGEPVAHPPAFSSTRRHSEVHLSRSGGFVSPPPPGSAGRR